MEGNEDSFGVLRLLESAHGFESCIEVTDVRLKSVRGVGNPLIDEVREGVAAGFPEALQDVLMDGIESEDVCGDETFQMLPAQEERLRGRIQEKFAVAVEDSFLRVTGMSAEPLELQSGLEVSQQVDVAALHVDAVGLQHLCEPRQAINRGCSEDGALFQNLLQEVIEDLRGFFAGAQSAFQQSCAGVPHQVFAVLLSANGERLAVENENAVRDMRIRKNSTRKIAVQGAHHCRVLDDVLCVSHTAVCASVEHVAIMEGWRRLPASAVDSECVLAGVAFPPATTEPDSVSRTTERALFFMDELREG